MKVTFQISTDEHGLTATVSADGAQHPDLLDELSRRCVRLFAEGNASLPDEPE